MGFREFRGHRYYVLSVLSRQEDLDAMERAVEEDCEKIDYDEW